MIRTMHRSQFLEESAASGIFHHDQFITMCNKQSGTADYEHRGHPLYKKVFVASMIRIIRGSQYVEESAASGIFHHEQFITMWNK